MLVLLLLIGPGVQAWWARRAAVRLLQQGAVSVSQDWLEWSARFTPKDGRADLIRAACFRCQHQEERFAEAIRSAEENGAPAELIEREAELARLQSGELPANAAAQMATMIESGASRQDVCAAFVYGFLTNKEPQRARKVLDAWAGDYPDEAAEAYMRGIFWRSVGESVLARESLEGAIKQQPRHELARTALAELLEAQGDFEGALAARIDLVDHCPSSETARLHLARLFRKAGRADDAFAVAAPLAASKPDTDVLWELGEIALELGDYEEAQRRFQESLPNHADRYRSALASASALVLQGNSAGAETILARLSSCATASALGGDASQAKWLFDRLNALYDRFHITAKLRAKLNANPNDASTVRQFLALSSKPVTIPREAATGDEKSADGDAAESGPELYALHCAACHGADGDGNGRAARYLFPSPKDLRSGNYRLIRTLNGVPAVQDVEAVIQRGMPGTSMPPFENLSLSCRALLAREVLRLYREGIREQIIAWMTDEGDEIDVEYVRQTLLELTTPGEAAPTPQIGPPSPGAVARGKQVYDRMGCVNCHGEDGTGSSDVLLVDDKGRLTSSRNLANEPLKGGDAPEAIYLRILLGMPGTPHPACPGLAEQEIVDLVQFCRSLSRKPQRNLTNYERMIRTTRAGAHKANAGDAPASLSNRSAK
jgi:mono/diheme cytochrome c family protein/predicted Zn-dependent protease